MQLGFSSGSPTPVKIAKKSSRWGLELKREIRESFDRWVAVWAILEQLPSEKNRIILADTLRDYFGRPAPQIHLSVGDYERRTLKHAHSKILEILREMGAEIDYTKVRKKEVRPYFDKFNGVSHHMGGCRMGNDPKKSVVDKNLKAHGVDNLFIVGSSVFVTGGAVNPTLTIAALALRTADHIMKNATASLH